MIELPSFNCIAIKHCYDISATNHDVSMKGLSLLASAMEQPRYHRQNDRYDQIKVFLARIVLIRS